MTKIVVIYKSKYGTTKRYAEWIAEELNASLFEAGTVKPQQLAEYDVVVYGGGLYAGGVLGVKLITKNHCKSRIVFTVGLADPATADYSKILAKNFTHEILSKTKIFHLHGGIDYSQLSKIHKCMMAMVKKNAIKKAKTEDSVEDRQFLETYGKKVDFTDRQNIKPIIDYVRNLLS